MTTERLHLMQSSMQHTDTRQEKVEDLTDVFNRVPDVAGFTEVDAVTWRLLGRTPGYEVFRDGSIALAVLGVHEILEVGRVDVLPGLRSPSGRGSHTARGILEVTFRTPEGNVCTVHEAHWITDAPSARREAKRAEQSEAMAERVHLHSEGRRISFWMGDTNEDEGKPEREVQKPLTSAGLLSIYDALHEYPDTHGKKTIDVIGHCTYDGRVRAEAVRVWPLGNKDHRSVSAWYSLRP